MRNNTEQKRIHSSQCHYCDEDALAYADIEVNGERITISAYEVGFFDELLECANNDDKDINIDFEMGDHFPYSIVYGGLFVSKWLAKEYKTTEALISWLTEDFRSNKGCPLAVIDDDYRNMGASVFQGAYIDTNIKHWQMDLFVPFAALVQTNEAVNDLPCPTTYFPLPKGLLWESMMNRPWLLAARVLQPLKEEQVDSWQKYIDTAKLYEAYEAADKVLIDS